MTPAGAARTVRRAIAGARLGPLALHPLKPWMAVAHTARAHAVAGARERLRSSAAAAATAGRESVAAAPAGQLTPLAAETGLARAPAVVTHAVAGTAGRAAALADGDPVTVAEAEEAAAASSTAAAAAATCVCRSVRLRLGAVDALPAVVAHAHAVNARTIAGAIVGAASAWDAAGSHMPRLAKTDAVAACTVLAAIMRARQRVRAVEAGEAREAAADAVPADAVAARGAVVGAQRRADQRRAVVAAEARRAEAHAGEVDPVAVAHARARDALVAIDAAVARVAEAAAAGARSLP
jgi:hypothetical protein